MIWVLLIVYQLKHFLADYPLQGRYMLGKFSKYPDYVMPLLAHVGVHGAFTLLIASACNCHYAPYLALFDATVHFLMDRIKASPDMLGRFKALSANEMKTILSYLPTVGEERVKEMFGSQLKGNTYFWWSLGLDQMVHHLTHYAIIYGIMVTT